MRMTKGSSQTCRRHRIYKSSNGHHDIEAIFKAVARALAEAVRIDPRVKGQHTTKGVLLKKFKSFSSQRSAGIY